MSNQDCTLSRTKEWFEKAVPNPELKNFNSQLGCHLEEVAEMLQTLSSVHSQTTGLLLGALWAVAALGEHLKTNSSQHLLNICHGSDKDFLDSLCDQIVTATGVAHMGGYDIVGAMDEVNDSNFSKFEGGQPLFDANRKIIKGSGYRKPNLEPFLKK